MTDQSDRDGIHYSRGYQSAMAKVLDIALQGLPSADGDAHHWRIERAETVAMLRNLCGEFGDNDWPDELYIPDIIDKHLSPYLAELTDQP